MVDSDKVSEINLRRLIKSCEKMGAQSAGVLDRDDLRTFVKYLGAAQKQRDELRASGAVTVSQLDEYSRKIDFLRDLADSSKLALPIDTQPTMMRLHAAPQLTSAQKTSAAHTRLRAKRRSESAMKESLTGRTNENDYNNNNNFNNENKLQREEDDDLAREELLQHNRNLQHNITEGMASMTASLKDNAYKISNILKEGNKTLNELNQLAENNVNSITTEAKRVKEHSVSTSWSTLSLCVLLVVVMMMFISTYMFMKMFPKVSSY